MGHRVAPGAPQLGLTMACTPLAGTLSHGTLPGFNKTVLQSLPRSVSLIIVESALMAAAFLAMLVVSAGAGGDRDGLDDGRSSLQALRRCWCCAERRTGPWRRLTCAASAGATFSSCPSSI